VKFTQSLKKHPMCKTYLLGGTLTSVTELMVAKPRSAVLGDYVNAFARNRTGVELSIQSTSGRYRTVAGLRRLLT